MKSSCEAIQDAFDDFKNKIIKINYMQSFTKSVYERQIEHLTEQIKWESEYPLKFPTAINFWIKDIRNGKLEHCEYNEFTINEKVNYIFELFNKQYQNLLVEAYESFEKYLKVAYTQISEFNPKYKQVDSKGKDRKNFNSLKFLKAVHNHIPQINQIINIRNQSDDKFLDSEKLLFMVVLTEELRHYIVHSHGYVHDKKKLCDECVKKIGIYNNGSYRKDFFEEMNLYFGANQMENIICLLDVYENSNANYLHRFHNRLGNLVGELVSYTKFVNHYLLYLVE